MVVQDARTGTVEHLGDNVSKVELQRLSPKGFARHLSEPSLTVLTPPRPAPKPEPEPIITLDAAPITEDPAPAEPEAASAPEPEAAFGTIESEDSSEPINLESLLSADDYLPEEVEIEEPQATEATSTDWEDLRSKLMIRSKNDLKSLAEFYSLSVLGTKSTIADRFEDIKDDVDLTLLD
jgi:hypothetical protein